MVENWNSTAEGLGTHGTANDVIFYARKGRLESNRKEDQEISMLSLHLLQNCLILINTILLEQTIEQQRLYDLLSEEDFRALTPLFHAHVNPYGQFEINLEKPSFLEAA